MDIVHIVWDISVSYLQCFQDKHVQGTMHIREHAVFLNVWTSPQFDSYRSIQIRFNVLSKHMHSVYIYIYIYTQISYQVFYTIVKIMKWIINPSLDN